MDVLTTDNTRSLLVYIIFPILASIGFYGTWYLGIVDGLFTHLADIVRGKTHVLPSTNRKVILKWTGIKPVDDYLAFYLAFFLPGSRNFPAMTLQTRHFVTQLMAIQALVQLQCNRKENSRLIQSSMIVTGFAAQTIAPGAVLPLWFATHLATSSLSRIGTLTDFGSISEARVASIPAAVLLSMFVPIVSAQYFGSNSFRQTMINVWQFFYLFSELFERLAPAALQSRFDSATDRVYTFAMALSTIGHLGVVVTVLLSKLAPSLLPKEYQRMSFTETFLPRHQLQRAGDMMEARLQFLRWDHTITCVSVVLWAVACYALASPDDALTTGRGFRFGVEILGRVCITGPAGAAAWALRERDWILL